MSKPEIQPLIPLIPRSLQINMLLIRAHNTPLPLPRPVPQDIVHLSKNKQRKSQNIDPNQHAVAAMIKWLIICAVDISANNAAELHGHVVAGGGYGARADAARVAGHEADEDGVAVGIAEQDGQEGVCAPGVNGCTGPDAEGDDAGEDPVGIC